MVGIDYAPDRYDSIHTAHPTWKMFASESSSAFRSRGIYNNWALLEQGGYADSKVQDDFCAASGCTVSKIYDQSPKGNHL